MSKRRLLVAAAAAALMVGFGAVGAAAGPKVHFGIGIGFPAFGYYAPGYYGPDDYGPAYYGDDEDAFDDEPYGPPDEYAPVPPQRAPRAAYPGSRPAYSAPSPGSRKVSCARATQVAQSHGYSRVSPIECTGRGYTVSGYRGERRYAIAVSAGGQITSVRPY